MWTITCYLFDDLRWYLFRSSIVEINLAVVVRLIFACLCLIVYICVLTVSPCLFLSSLRAWSSWYVNVVPPVLFGHQLPHLLRSLRDTPRLSVSPGAILWSSATSTLCTLVQCRWCLHCSSGTGWTRPTRLEANSLFHMTSLSNGSLFTSGCVTLCKPCLYCLLR